ncbi:hypothetical protein ILUMI_12410 [Ignelater luminosus]|uniref:Cytochrome P450 n=1 Tax=Ignelater luminosus TaxID=2038154 RepID=A0A8K0CUA0_IGNLU|nr:hypothetical protein ILUMI_12410 [Ignelater luminosus]
MFFTLSAYIGLILTILLYLYLTRNFNYWKKRNIDYVKPVAIFGNIYKVVTLQSFMGEFLAELYNITKKPFIGFFAFDKPFLLIRDPELIKRCLIKDFEHFDDRSVMENRRDDEIGSNILFVLKNPAWKSVRVRFTPVFATGKMRGLLPLILEASNDLIAYIKNIAVKETATETREVAMKFTTDIISSCAFGISSHCFLDENATFREASRRVFDWSIGRKISTAAYFFAPLLVKLFRLKFLEPNATQFIYDIFESTIAEREKSKAYRGDLIDMLIQIRNQNQPGAYQFDGKMLAAQATQFFVAGFETTGSTISFSLYELSLNPTVQDRVREEIRTVIKKHGGITYEAIQEMDYLNMTVKETLRKYPVLPFIDRRCTKPYNIPGTDVTIEKDVPIYISLLGLHYDAEYFPNPEKYDPERFTIENKSTRPADAYIPFGEGPRNCIGARFGELGTKVALIRILAEFEVEVCKKTRIPLKFDPKGFLIAPKNGIDLHFKRKE